jgi:excisionase family DNA binding protein
MTFKYLLDSDLAVISRSQAAEVLNCDPRTVSRGIAEGTIPSLKIGRRVFIPVAQFLALIQGGFGSTHD